MHKTYNQIQTHNYPNTQHLINLPFPYINKNLNHTLPFFTQINSFNYLFPQNLLTIFYIPQKNLILQISSIKKSSHQTIIKTNKKLYHNNHIFTHHNFQSTQSPSQNTTQTKLKIT